MLLHVFLIQRERLVALLLTFLKNRKVRRPFMKTVSQILSDRGVDTQTKLHRELFGRPSVLVDAVGLEPTTLSV